MTQLQRTVLLASLCCVQILAQESAVRAAEAFIRKHDTNGDYRVEFREFKESAEVFKQIDKSGDGLVTVGDFVRKDVAPPAEAQRLMNEKEYFRYYGFQIVPRYDRDKDGVLSDEELQFMLIVVMDYDEDRALHALEIKKSRTPPGLALEEGWFAKDAKAFDTNGDTVVTSAEMRVPEVVKKTLDKNRDGKVTIEELARAEIGQIGGYFAKFREMSESVLRLGKLDKANWLADVDAFAKLDMDKDGVVSVAEFDRYARGLKLVLSMCPDFVTRFDLDGDAKVARDEFPGTDAIFARMDRNKDGSVTAADR